MTRQMRITVAEASAIIRSGILSLIRQLDIPRAELFEVDEPEQLRGSLGWQKPDVIIINPSFIASYPLQQIRKEANPGVRIVAIQTLLSDSSAYKLYDETISLYDGPEQVREKLARLTEDRRDDKRHESLSQREKQVIACVIKGMTNKQIAEKLCLSTHTVITHRRNISAKLDIHSTAGFNIYDNVNKLEDIDSISPKAINNI